ncbi:hypothetical protein KFK09_021065 [Dendrobium nobile]|uniref:Uncharacterized protein n=1 Tax=Dendrobium nobile TaxID=94219 RepID=A0A8T3ANP8_DENNO|nr:hypothetical protein KFK09_021065 [Dendrobium nobile]
MKRAKGRKLPSQLEAPVLASDQNVVTSVRTGGKVVEGAKSNSQERAEEATRAIYTPPAKQRSRAATTKREDEW